MDHVAPIRVRFDAFELDEANRRLTRNGQRVDLTPRALAVLCELVRHRGDLVSKDALLDAVWGHHHVSESVLKTVISQLRSILPDDARQPRYIETVSRFGYRFIGGTETAAGSPADSRAIDHRAPSIVGRAAALDRLHRCWAGTLAGERQLVWIIGDAGIGKTTLIEAFVRELPPEVSVTGRCVEHFGAGEPYLPLLEALNTHCRREPELADVLRTVAPTWLLQMPWHLAEDERARLHRELAGTHPDRMVRELAELMRRYTANRPLLLVLEDLHWSDLGTLRMMEHFARQPRDFAFMWIASFRLTQVVADEHPLRELRQELRLHGLCEEIHLDPFSETEVGEYLRRHTADGRVTDELVRRLHTHTDGLPLFIASVTDALLGNHSVVPEGEDPFRFLESLPLPDTLTGVLDRQLARLDTEAAALLEAASVCGGIFRADLLANVAGISPDRARQICDGLARRRLWLRHLDIVDGPDGSIDSRYAFLHALHRQFFYQRIPAAQRVEYHREAAAWLRRERERGRACTPVELALHLERGRELPAAIDAYCDGADIALAQHSPADAAELAARGRALLDLCPDATRRRELEFRVLAQTGTAMSLMHGVGSDEALTAFERVEQLYNELPPTAQRAIALNGLGWVHFTRGQYGRALELADRLLCIAEASGDDGLFVFGCNLRGVTNVWLGKLEVAREALNLGLERIMSTSARDALGRLVVDPEVSMRANLAIPLMDLGHSARGLEQLRLAQQRAEQLQQPIARMLVHWISCQACIRLEDHEQFAVHAHALAAVVEAAVLAHGEGPSLWMRGWARLQQGDAEAGFRDIVAGYALHTREGMYAGCTEVLAMAVEASLRAGDLRQASARLDEAFALALRIGERLTLPWLHLQRAQLCAAMNDVVAAEAALRLGLEEARSQHLADGELRLLALLHELGLASPLDMSSLANAVRARPDGSISPALLRAQDIIGARRPAS